MNKRYVMYIKNGTHYKAVLNESQYQTLLKDKNITHIQDFQNEQVLNMFYESKTTNNRNKTTLYD